MNDKQLYRKYAKSKCNRCSIYLLSYFSRRAKQEDGETDDDDDHHPTTNGFVPIQQGIHNVEENSTFSTDLNDVITTRF